MPVTKVRTSVLPVILERENTRLREDLTRTERDRDRWKRHTGRLQQQLDAARRAGFRQAAPFAKERRQGCGKRPGRRAGSQYGRHGMPPAAGSGRRNPSSTAADQVSGLRRRARSRARRDAVIRKTSRWCGPLCGASTSRSATARSAGGASKAAMPCRPLTRWGRPACNWGPKSPPWSCRCTRRWARR